MTELEERRNGLPAAPNAEAGVLGACLSEGAAWWRMVEHRSPGDPAALFQDPHHRVIAAAMHRALEAEAGISITAVQDELLGRDGDRLPTKPHQFLLSLQAGSGITTPSEMHEALGALAGKHALRQQLVGVERIRTGILDGRLDSTAVGADLRQLSLDHSVTREVPTLDEVVRGLETEDRKPWNVSTGFGGLDELINDGWEPGRLYILGARPKVGKTTLMVNSIDAALAEGAVVLCVSLEMSDREIWSKLWTARALVEHRTVDRLVQRKLVRKDLDPDQRDRLDPAAEELRNSPLHLMFAPDVRNGSESVISAMMHLRARYGEQRPMVVFIDYLQLMAGSHFNRNAEIGQMTRDLKLAAQELSVAVVALSQLNRGAAEGGMPHPHQLRESGAMEQDADGVLMMHRPYLDNAEEPEHIMQLWLALNRVGPAGTLELFWYPAYSLVSDADMFAADDPGGSTGV